MFLSSSNSVTVHENKLFIITNGMNSRENGSFGTKNPLIYRSVVTENRISVCPFGDPPRAPKNFKIVILPYYN